MPILLFLGELMGDNKNSVKKKTKGKKIKATFGALITLLSAIYKLVTGFFVGLIFMASGIYTFAIFLCKLSYARNLDADMESQYKSYRNMGILLIIVSIFFLIANIITMDDEPKNYGLVFNIIISSFLILLFILSLKGYLKKRANANILFRAIKVLSLSTALINLVLVEKLFLYYLYNNLSIDFIYIHKWFVLGISGILIFIGAMMFINYLIRYNKYKKGLK
jgi:hypothetical protein